jgi:hypothetical protein
MDSAASLLLGTADEVALNVASHLDSAWDLVCLQRACKRFAVLCICAPQIEKPWGRLVPLNPQAQPHLLTQPVVSLGRGHLRGDTCDVPLPNLNHYSRRHCVLTRGRAATGGHGAPAAAESGRALLTNLSSNGTWVQPRGAGAGVRIFKDEEVELRSGDTFSLLLPVDGAMEKFGDKAAAFVFEDSTALPEPAVERLSMVEDVARKWLERCSPEERAWVPRRGHESYIGRMREVQSLLPGPLELAVSHPQVKISSDGGSATMHGGGYRGVATSAVLRAGKHYAECTIDAVDYIFFGLLPADAKMTGGAHGEDPVDHPGGCFYSSESGTRWNGTGEAHWHATGMQRAVRGDVIGLLWDRDGGGSLAVYKNGRRLGVMQQSGLCGEYRWCVALFNRGDTARIEAKLATEQSPKPPSVEHPAEQQAQPQHAHDPEDEDEDADEDEDESGTGEEDAAAAVQEAEEQEGEQEDALNSTLAVPDSNEWP